MKEKTKDKIAMYDMLIANLIAGNSIIEPNKQLTQQQLHVGFNAISTKNTLTKYFIIRDLPDYMPSSIISKIRNSCLQRGVKIDFYMHSTPYKIQWESSEMQNRMNIWKKYTAEQNSSVNTFDYRGKREALLARNRILESTKYLNATELDFKRTLEKTSIIIVMTAKRDEESLYNLSVSIKKLKGFCSSYDIKIKELKANLLDWLKSISPFSLAYSKEINEKTPKKLLSDDILANFNSYSQGRIGDEGVCLGIDVLSQIPILKKFKGDPDAAENWLVSATTGGGKSYYVKTLLTYLLMDNFVVTVMDYEGDEYLNLANYLRASNPEDVKVVSMGKGSAIYFDPMEIPQLTGDSEIDDDLKETAINYTLALFRIIVCGVDGQFDKWSESVISQAIKEVYLRNGINEDKNTWEKSKGLNIRKVYDRIKEMVVNKELVDATTDNLKHKAAVDILESCVPYFEEGEAKAGTFKHPMSANELYKAKFIVFSFGMKGATSSQQDPVILALKQLSVANVSIQISNYCKYVKHCFNVKVWEEFQRWGDVKGSAEIISNAMTGGRKRGDVNIIITNDLQSILDDDNPINTRLRQNITSYAIGGIADSQVRDNFCKKFSIKELSPTLEEIAKANTTGDNSRNFASKYKHAFCLVLDNGKKAIAKVNLPPSLAKSELFKTGVILK